MDVIMSKFAYDSLSEEEKKTFVELCKEDPAVFIERVVGINLKEYQKVYIRETFKKLLKEKNDILRLQFQQEPVNPRCTHCNGVGFVPIGPGVRGIKKCPYCGWEE